MMFPPSNALYVGPQVRQLVTDLSLRGLSELRVYTDFDHTLTFPTSLECHEVFASCNGLPQAFQAAVRPLLDFETPGSPGLVLDADAWWSTYHNALVAADPPLHRSQIGPIVASTGIELRPGADDLLRACCERRVPILVASAGITDIILSVIDTGENVSAKPQLPVDVSQSLLERSARYTNVTVLANRCEFDASDRLVGMLPRAPYHSLNKASTTELVGEFLSSTPRHCGIVLGDKPRDGALGLEAIGVTTLRVGFANGGERHQMSDYEAAYDVVLPRNSPLDCIVELIASLG
uniref:5'-nucleotidase n=1 Tax=Corethron hystrix TaxID=216773 RepID=A0A7S1BMT7_9STRA|mmetsp:Transcript_34660/g.80141  ORF Transcript_34660/g.80141 Transcript_34660/m.80141 type:complete len:293 (+) Transcript_34660:103-981(+)